MFPDDNLIQPAFLMMITLGLGKVCVKESLSPSHGRLLLTLQPIVFFFLVLIVWLIARFEHCSKLMSLLQKRRSLVHVLWLFIVYSYLSLAFTSLAFLTCVQVGTRWVLAIDGSVECFQGNHIPYAVISLLTFAFVVIPPPFLCGMRRVQFSPRFKELMDEATDIYEDNHRWYVSVNLFRRLGIVLLGALAAFVNVSVKMLLTAVYLLLLLVFHALVR